MNWVDCGPMGLRNELRGGIVATVGRRVRAAVSWSLSHSDSRLVTRGQSATIAAAKSDALAAAPAYALTLADAIEVRATALSMRAAAIRAAVGDLVIP